MSAARANTKPNANVALALLLAINLFNYIDRQVLAALEPEIRDAFFKPDDPNAMTETGLLGSAFLITYMLAAPALGWLSDRFSRWVIVGCSVLLWSLASGASGLAATFAMLFATRVFVGIGEGGYGPAAPTILADLFPIEKRGKILAIFCAAIPVGSALGYVLGGAIGPTHLGWRWAFYLVTPPGILLAALCFFQRDPRASFGERVHKNRASLADYLALLHTPSYVLNCLAQTAFTFAIGGLGYFVAAYLRYRGVPDSQKAYFGLITVIAGLGATLLGGWLGDRLRPRFAAAYFLVSGIGMLLAFPFFVAALYIPFPLAWIFLFIAIFFTFLNTGPSATALANVSRPAVRATAFAMNILVIHACGDVLAFPTIGYIGGHSNMNVAFLVVSVVMLISGIFWIAGMKYLPADVARVEATND